jgi:protein involved in sex pheromone biosynthesis
MRLSKSTFSPDRYIYQEGQYLTQDKIESWLEHKSKDNAEGLNPSLPKNYDDMSVDQKIAYLTDHPSYLSYVTEQDYLVQSGKNKLKLGGISIAVSMAKVYSFKVEDENGGQYRREVDLDPSVAKEKAKQYAESIVKRLRQIDGLQEVPIVIGLYQEETAESLVPGNYFAKTVVEAGDQSIGNWDKVNESHVLFPSSQASEKFKADSDRFDKFRKDIQHYFPNFVGVIGKGFYKQQELQHLTIDIPIKFYGETEVISFSQYVSGLLSDKNNPFPDVPTAVYISSTQGPEALVVRKPDMDEPFVHVFKEDK